MSAESATGVKRLFVVAREHLSNALIGGFFIMLTGFTPEHWVGHVLEAVHLSPAALKSLTLGFDPRIILVLVGVAVIVGDQLLKRHAAAPRLQLAEATGSHTATAAFAPAVSVPERPSIAVLPFQNMSGDPEQEYFADGMVEDIITALARFPALFVIARNSCFTYKGRSVDIKQVGRELGVRYVLEGSVRKSADRIRITGQLIDAATGAHLWAERIDGALEEIFKLQDQVTSSVVGAIAPKLEQAEIERVKRKPTKSLDAYDYYLRAMAKLYEGKRQSIEEALSLFQKAIDRDPGFAAAYGMSAYCYVWRKANGWVADRSRETAEATSLAHKAAQLGRDDAIALSEAGFALAFVAGELDHGAALIDRAVALNPNLASAWRFSGYTRVFLGDSDLAIRHLEQAVRLSPLDPLIFIVYNGIALAHFFACRYDEASKAAEMAGPNYITAVLMLAVSEAMAGRSNESARALARLRELDADPSMSKFAELWPLRRPEDCARFQEGMRKLGLPA